MGATKDRLLIGGRPILSVLLDRLLVGCTSERPSTLLVASPAHPSPRDSGRFDRVVLDDKAYRGPVAGIATALRAAQTPVVAVLSVDMPMVTRGQVDWLVERLLSAGPDSLGVFPRWRDEVGQDRLEPFPAVYRTAAAEVVGGWQHESQASGGSVNPRPGRSPSVRSLASDRRFQVVDCPATWPSQTWLNLNRPSDLADAGGLLGEVALDRTDEKPSDHPYNPLSECP